VIGILKFFPIIVCISVILISGCEGTGISNVDIPTELNGDWNITGALIANDDSRRVDINQDFEIMDGRIYLQGDGEIDGTFIANQLIIKFKSVVFDQDVEGSGRVKITADASIVTTILNEDEPEYNGIAVGVFKTESEIEGESSVELSGNFVLKRI